MSDVYLWDTYEKVGRDALERRDYEQAVESFKAAVTLAEALPSDDPRLVISLRHLSQALSKQGQLSMAYELLQRTQVVATEKLGADHSEAVQLARDLFDLARQLGFLEQAEGYLTTVLREVRRLGETEEFLEILELLAQLAVERERPGDAAKIYQEIVEARSTLYGESDPSVSQALLWLSTALTQSGQGHQAQAPLEKAFAMLEGQFAEDPESLAQSLLAGADLMTQSGQLEAALEHQKRALDLLSALHDEGHQSVWDARELIASTLAGLGQLEESIELLEFCLQHRGSQQDHRTGGLLKNLAGLYLSTQRIERAEELYQQATDILRATLGADHPATMATLEERIQLYHFTGRSQQALDLALTTIRATEARYGAGHPSTAQAYASTAVLAHASQKWETAYELMKAAEAIWDSLSPKPHDVLDNCRVNLATCLLELRRFEEAATALNKVRANADTPLGRVVTDLRARLESPESPAPLEENPTLRVSDPSPELDTPLEPESSVVSLEQDEESEPSEVIPSIEPRVIETHGVDDPMLEGGQDVVEDDDIPFQTEVFPDDSTLFGHDISPPQNLEEGFSDPSSEVVEVGESDADVEFAQEVETSETLPPPEAPLPQDPPYEGEDRRAEQRFNLGLNQFFNLSIVNDQEELVVIQSFLADLSLGGLRVNSEKPLPEGETFHLTVPAELLGEDLSVKARVVWQRALFGATFIQGIELLDLAVEQRDAITKIFDESESAAQGRQHYRLYRPFPIQVHHPDQPDWIGSYASDLSVEGVGTRLQTSLPTGEEVRLRLNLEFELPTVEVAAVVAWSRKGDNGVSHGLKFDEVGPVEAKTIKLYIDRCLEMSAD